MQTLKLSVSLPDETHPDMELRLSADDLACDVVITVPAGVHMEPPTTPAANEAPRDVVIRLPPAKETETTAANDAYVLGGYADI
ncbi:MAG: hypothetical protein EOP90_13170 [Lysobacteraceae bacterium]|nr:MAG: hypothetical protein EOP90_13170 [Xanthomonadaceae bacterium]